MIGACWKAACSVLIFALAGCYESSRPLGPAELGVIDQALVGTWRCVAPADKQEVAHLLVLPFDRSQYYLEWREDGKIDRYHAHSTKVRDTTLFNVAEIQPKGASKWFFYRVTTGSDGSRSLAVVHRDLVKEKDEAKALEEIARRAEDDTLYKLWADCTFEK